MLRDSGGVPGLTGADAEAAPAVLVAPSERLAAPPRSRPLMRMASQWASRLRTGGLSRPIRSAELVRLVGEDPDKPSEFPAALKTATGGQQIGISGVPTFFGGQVPTFTFNPDVDRQDSDVSGSQQVEQQRRQIRGNRFAI